MLLLTRKQLLSHKLILKKKLAETLPSERFVGPLEATREGTVAFICLCDRRAVRF